MRVEVVWRDDDGALSGWVEVTNDGPEILRLPGRPSVTPLATDGSRLDVPHIVTAELRRPGYVDLPTGGRARAPVTWGPATGRPRAGTSWWAGVRSRPWSR